VSVQQPPPCFCFLWRIQVSFLFSSPLLFTSPVLMFSPLKVSNVAQEFSPTDFWERRSDVANAMLLALQVRRLLLPAFPSSHDSLLIVLFELFFREFSFVAPHFSCPPTPMPRFIVGKTALSSQGRVTVTQLQLLRIDFPEQVLKTSISTSNPSLSLFLPHLVFFH
jgi:hypothetical protein